MAEHWIAVSDNERELIRCLRDLDGSDRGKVVEYAQLLQLAERRSQASAAQSGESDYLVYDITRRGHRRKL